MYYRTLLAVPPTLRRESYEPRHHKKYSDADVHKPWRKLKAIEQLAGDIVRRRHGQRQHRQLGREDTPAKFIFNFALQYHGRKHPQNTAAAVREPEYDEGKNETRRAAEQHVTNAAEQKRDADEHLHPFTAFARNPARDNRTDRRADAARREQHADTARSILADRKYFFTDRKSTRLNSS